jgi:hypothetical protein
MLEFLCGLLFIEGKIPRASGKGGWMKLVSTDIAVGESGKADFDDIYAASDPREYYRVLCGLDYIIPDLSKSIFRSLIKYCSHDREEPLKVLDIGSSYGINSALIEYPLDIQRMLQRYSCPEMYRLTSDRVRLLDRNYFSSWPRRSDTIFYGVDVSKAAISYAKSVGLIEDGVTTNMEISDPTESEKRILGDADMIITTGCVGYVTHRTFERIFECQNKKRPPLVASFVLRMYSYDDVAAELEKQGLITEKLEGITFVQRRFNSSDEYNSVMSQLSERGVDPAGKEAEGLYHAELFVSRTEEEIKKTPLADLLSVSSGTERRFGRRLRRMENGLPRLMQ